jgi:signal transduction histidine kinase
VRVALLRLASILFDAEAGAQGYAASGHPRLLEPYASASARYRAAFDAVRSLTRSEPAQQEQLDALEPVMDHEVDLLRRLVEAHSRGVAGEGLVPLLTDSKEAMDDIRGRISQLLGEEQRLEVGRLRTESTSTSVSIGVLSAAVALLVAASVWLAQRESMLEREQSARGRAERASSLAELFVAVLGHDLRTPLFAITTSAAVLARSASGERERRIAMKIMGSGGRMARLIDQILDFSRIRANQGLSFRPAPIDLREVIARVREELAGGTAIEVQAEGSTEGKWDHDRLSQVFSNLVANAIEHSPDGGPVGVRIDGHLPDRAEVTVENRGVIPPAVLATLFEPFQAARPQEKSKGLGLGLYITQEIVRAHGGSIDVTSSEEEGTRFRVVLPRSAPGADGPGA